ncbi:hypothetical protein AcW1_009126 [Taiwanofungus camphoratus]|nr:hypothetical protein AcW1_009126 [Antrodia cinnamomea]KAI0958637.1 hypothetical protein AcV7_004396 [Antrodia cinnamomea]
MNLFNSIRASLRGQTIPIRSIHSSKAWLSSAGNPLNKPSPPPLPREEQREFEELVRAAQAPLVQPTKDSAGKEEVELALHPDARAPLVSEFEGETNPFTGEKGGPKREPVQKWGEGEGDWSFKGRVSDF